MALIDLRDATIYLKDGLTGAAVINDASITEADTTLAIDTVVLVGPSETDLVPVGARFTAPNTASQVFTVTARDPANAGPTTAITFTPAFTANIPANAASLTFEAQRVAVTIGEGNLSYTEAQNMDYTLDRGVLDTVRQGDDIPVDVSMDFSYEFATTGTNEVITPADALKGIGGASEWVSSASDLCEPYAVDVEIDRALSCGSVESENTMLSDYRWESLEFSLRGATISSSGKCNVTTATNTRS